jgi:hypothetical protein
MNILQAVVRTLRQPDGSYQLPLGNRIVQRTRPAPSRTFPHLDDISPIYCRTCGRTLPHFPAPAPAPALHYWTVCCTANGIEYWLTRSLTWGCPQTWPNDLWDSDFGFATPEEAYFAWLQWTDGREEG